jgi:hypothetical protein
MKKSIKRTLAIALALLLTIGIGIPAFAAPATTAKAAAPAAPAKKERSRTLTFAILLIPYIGPFIAYFTASDRSAMLPPFIVTLFTPILGALLYLFGVL